MYISITQLLIRRSLFDHVGLFESTWGSVGDFNWAMKAGLVANTVHVPDTWGGWRVHPNQATATARFGSADHFRRIDEMIEHAFNTCEPFLAPVLRQRVKADCVKRLREFRAFAREIAQCRTVARRRLFVGKRLLTGSAAAREQVKSSILRTQSWQDAFPDRLQRWLEEEGFGPALVSTANSTSQGVGSLKSALQYF